jgi:enoyl-CoA hydratase/carnithine racemase
MTESEIISEKQGGCGVITLNRPQALNAVTNAMTRAIEAALAAWEQDPGVKTVILRAAGGKAFCAGGDIKRLYELGKAGRYDEQLTFYREEYHLNRRMQLYPKPIVALLDGIVMGGGAGLAMHCSHRVAGDQYTFAMPEVAIGLFPDVGATYFLSRLPGNAGTYLALTAGRADVADAVAIGLVKAYVPSAKLAELTERLIAGEAPDAVIASLRADPPSASKMMEYANFIKLCFAPPTVDAILGEIDEAGYAGMDFATQTYDAIARQSPTCLAIALRQMQIGPKFELDEVIKLEYRLMTRMMRSADFYEGVRAVLIDKDRQPKWNPSEIDAVKQADVDAYFAPLAEGELDIKA